MLTDETLQKLSKDMLNANTAFPSGRRMIHPESNLLIKKYTRNENRPGDPLLSTVQQTGNYMLRVPISLSPPSKRRLTGDSDTPATGSK